MRKLLQFGFTVHTKRLGSPTFLPCDICLFAALALIGPCMWWEQLGYVVALCLAIPLFLYNEDNVQN